MEQGAEGQGLDPDEVAARRFRVRFRGYDRHEVARFLEQIAAAQRDRPATAVPESAAVASPPPPPPPPGAPVVMSLDDEIAARFGDDLADVVRQTRAHVRAIETAAEERANGTLADAERTANRVVQEAQARADHLAATEARLQRRLADARSELTATLDNLDRPADAPESGHAVIDLSEHREPAPIAASPVEVDRPSSMGRTGVATLAEPRLAEPTVIAPPVEAPAENEFGGQVEGEDDEAFDRMVRDALERAVRLRRPGPETS